MPIGRFNFAPECMALRIEIYNSMLADVKYVKPIIRDKEIIRTTYLSGSITLRSVRMN